MAVLLDERIPLLLPDDAEARVVPEEAVAVERDARAAVAVFALDARAVAEVDDARVLVLPNVRAAADWRASPAVRDTRVPSIEGAVVPRDAREAVAGTVVRAVAPRVSRCN